MLTAEQRATIRELASKAHNTEDHVECMALHMRLALQAVPLLDLVDRLVEALKNYRMDKAADLLKEMGEIE